MFFDFFAVRCMDKVLWNFSWTKPVLTAFSFAVELTLFEIFTVKCENRRPFSLCHNSHTSHAFPHDEGASARKVQQPPELKKSFPFPFCFRFYFCLQRRFLAKAKGRKTKHVPHGKRIYYAGISMGKNKAILRQKYTLISNIFVYVCCNAVLSFSLFTRGAQKPKKQNLVRLLLPLSSQTQKSCP